MSNYIFSHSDWASIDLSPSRFSCCSFVSFEYDGRRCGYRNPRIAFSIQFIEHTGLYAHTNYPEWNSCSAVRFLFRMGLWLIPSSGLLTVERDGLLSAVHFLSTRSRTHLFDIWCYSDVKYVSGYVASPKKLWIIDLTQISLKECFPKLHRFPSMLYS